MQLYVRKLQFPAPKGRGNLGSNSQPKHAIANCCYHLSHTNERFAATWRIESNRCSWEA